MKEPIILNQQVFPANLPIILNQQVFSGIFLNISVISINNNFSFYISFLYINKTVFVFPSNLLSSSMCNT